jgi:hypothetical protein
MREARHGRYGRPGRVDTGGKARRMRVERLCGCERQGRADVRVKDWRMLEARQGG